MLLTPAVASDYSNIVELANLAYRGTGNAAASWNIETGIIDGRRLTEHLLRDDLVAKPHAHLLLYRDVEQGPLLGTVWLEPKQNGVWHLGLLTIHPEVQDRRLGRALLGSAEDFAQARGCRLMQMTVLHVRHALVGWYLRRGYSSTGKRVPFPYGDERFGKPLREDLYFVVLEKQL